MKYTTNHLLVILSFLFVTNILNASHYQGGNISYVCLGNNQYEVTMVAYRDCNGITLPNSVSLDYTSTCDTFSSNADIIGIPQEVSIYCPSVQSSCVLSSGNLGISKYIYRDTVTLLSCADWRISYGFGSPNGIDYVETLFDNLNISCNQSPVFQNEHIFYTCLGDTAMISFNAFDADGDSLVYSLTPFLAGHGQAGTYNPGYSGTQPLSGNVSIDSKTGLLTVMPTILEIAPVCVKVEEYRNGVKIGENRRDVHLTIMNCNANALPKVSNVTTTNTFASNLYIAYAGDPINLNFQIYDTEVQAGTQNLSVPTVYHQTMIGATTSFANSTLQLNWNTSLSDVGLHDVNMTFEDDYCAILGKNHYAVQVLILQPPTMIANDDYVATILDTPVSGNVAQNDISSGLKVVNTTPVLTPPNGFVTIASNGNFTYTPNTGYAGIDSFTYEICNGSYCTNATVYVNIHAPITITDTIILGESYPNYYCLSDSAYLVSDTLQNAVLTFVNDSCVALYGDYLGTDTVMIQSYFETVILQLTVENGVWPGDTDDDAIVNNVDLLNIGVAYGTVGIPRDSQTIAWNGYFASDWDSTFTTGLNFKYADADGNGIINDDDTLAIMQNWALTYNKNGGGNGAPIYLATNALTITNDSIVTVPIMLGNAQSPVSSIYGLAFSVSYNWELVKEGTAYVSFDSTWLGTNNQNIISIQKDFYDDELIETAVTRIDGINVNGFGQIGTLGFTIQDDIIRGTDSLFSFNVLNVNAIQSDASTVDLQGENRNIHWETIINIANNTSTIDLSNYLQIYPNPTTDYLTILAKAITIENVEIFDMTGRKVLSEYSWNNRNQLNISELNEGIYMVHIQTDLGIWNERIMVVKP